MNRKEADNIRYCICRHRWCNECPLYKGYFGTACDSLDKEEIVLAGRNLFFNNDDRILKALKYYKERPSFVYETFMKYCGGVQYG